MSSARISIVLPAFNVAEYIADTVLSLQMQTWPDLEIIAINDGSSDATFSILENSLAAFRASGAARQAYLISQTNQGAGSARNAGLGRASGDLVMFCDGDDLLTPHACRDLAQHLLETPELRLVFSRCTHIDENGARIGVTSPQVTRRLNAADLIRDNPIHSGTGVMLRRKTLQAIAPFDTSLPACIDLELWVRATEDHGMCISGLDKICIQYRRRTGQITSNWRHQQTGWSAIAARARSAGVLNASEFKQAHAKNLVVWATTAYQARDYGSARKLVTRALRTAPLEFVTSRMAVIRLLACAATLLPGHLHDSLQRWFNQKQ